MQRIKEAPLRRCASCQARLVRKRFNGRLEDFGGFLKRRYCDRRCMATGYEKEICNSKSHSRSKAHRKMKEACEVCGLPALHVHHMDEDWSNNSDSNLQSLCASCHRLSHSPNFLGTPTRRKPCALCSAPRARDGLCNTHLTRLKRHGDPLLVKVRIGSSWVLVRDASRWGLSARSQAKLRTGLVGSRATATPSSLQ